MAPFIGNVSLFTSSPPPPVPELTAMLSDEQLQYGAAINSGFSVDEVQRGRRSRGWHVAAGEITITLNGWKQWTLSVPRRSRASALNWKINERIETHARVE